MIRLASNRTPLEMKIFDDSALRSNLISTQLPNALDSFSLSVSYSWLCFEAIADAAIINIIIEMNAWGLNSLRVLCLIIKSSRILQFFYEK